MKDILHTIQNNYQKFTPDTEIFNFNTLRKKREELIELGKIIGCKEDVFKNYLNSLEVSYKYSCFSHSFWGYYTPSIINDFVINNQKRPKKLVNKKPQKPFYYQYVYDGERLVALNYISNENIYSTTYFCYVENRIYSFTFPQVFKYEVCIYEADFDKNGKIKTIASTDTFGLSESETDEKILRKCQRGIRAALLDFQYYYYNDLGNLEYGDNYTRIYNFSPQIAGLKLGQRIRFTYDDNGKIIGWYYSKDEIPCVFEPTPEEKNTPFDNTDRSYEYFKNIGLL